MNPHKYNRLSLSIAKILAFWNDPVGMQAMILAHNTNWPGDRYALVQRQAQMARTI